MVELLAPAGSFESVATAIYFGADAVYLGGSKMQLRADSSGFDDESLKSTIEYIHSKNKKAYVTVNSFMRNDETGVVAEYARFLRSIKADAVIVSDVGAVYVIKNAAPDLEIHISTQANCMNYAAASVYYSMGAKRVVIAREMSLEDIKRMRENIPPDMEIEAFVHGAMCMSYSGRCMISAFLNNRSSNRGDCTQPCRWKYRLVEETRPNMYIPVTEDDKGTYILSSHDLKCIEFLDELERAGVYSFKIEGRMKSPYYVATATNAYRHRIDGTAPVEFLNAELDAVSHRPYSSGFYYGEMKKNCNNDGSYVQSCVFTAVVKESGAGYAVVEQRNRFQNGDVLEVLSPSSVGLSFAVSEITEDGIPVEIANKPTGVYKINCPVKLNEGDILRRRL